MSIPAVGFAPLRGPGLDFEAMSIAAVSRRVPTGWALHPHRTDFHSIALVRAGRGEHTVDFVTYPCSPGTLLWIRPGQVQRFEADTQLDAPMMVFTAAFPPRFGTADRLLTAARGLTRWDAVGPAIDLLFSQLIAEYQRTDVSREILQFLLGALLVEIDRLPHDDSGSGNEVYTRFLAELERSYLTTRRAEDYAARLGYTVRTLTRACLDATGHPVKQLIDERVILQAKRLLAHTDAPIARIARQLGFTEPTNFGKFFARHTATTPGAFRDSMR
ncbi:AraC family transcriptional regulator [Actinocrispum sp. NPDC049592]|uniref:helix-turn-helix domain-containing protein n=1 Tax=Actinocrispum sp. NPDC049592 TaxID=3154835 RepID=UPI00343F0266